VLEPLASALAVLTEDEKELGVALVEMGAGTTDLAVFHEGKIRHLGTIAFGGNNVTNDIVHGLGVTQADAERLKEKHGCAYEQLVDSSEIIKLPSTVAQGDRQIPRELLAHIIHQRMDEIFDLVQRDVSSAGFAGKLAAGVVITGGAAAMQGAAELASDVFGTGVRVGTPSEQVGGLSDSVDAPRFATVVGLAQYGAHRMALGGASASAKRIKLPGGGGMDKLGNGDHIVTLPPTGTAASSGNNGVGKIVTLPSSGPTASSGHNGVGKIVTLPPSGASSGNNGTGKVIDLPGGRLNKTGVSQDSKFNGVVTRFDDRSAKPLPHIDQQRRLDQQPAAKPRMNFGPSPTRQGLGNTNAGSDLHVASGPAMQSQARSNGKLMRW